MLQQNGFRRALSGVQRTSRKSFLASSAQVHRTGRLAARKRQRFVRVNGFPQFLLLHRLLPLLMSVTRLEDGFPLSFPSLQLFHAISTSFLPLPSSFGLGLACPASPTGPRQRSDGRCTLQRRIRRENTNLGLP